MFEALALEYLYLYVSWKKHNEKHIFNLRIKAFPNSTPVWILLCVYTLLKGDQNLSLILQINPKLPHTKIMHFLYWCGVHIGQVLFQCQIFDSILWFNN